MQAAAGCVAAAVGCVLAAVVVVEDTAACGEKVVTVAASARVADAALAAMVAVTPNSCCIVCGCSAGAGLRRFLLPLWHAMQRVVAPCAVTSCHVHQLACRDLPRLWQQTCGGGGLGGEGGDITSVSLAGFMAGSRACVPCFACCPHGSSSQRQLARHACICRDQWICAEVRATCGGFWLLQLGPQAVQQPAWQVCCMLVVSTNGEQMLRCSCACAFAQCWSTWATSSWLRLQVCHQSWALQAEQPV